MITTVAHVARRLISERHIAIRSGNGIRYLTLTRSSQIAGFLALIVGSVAVTQLTAGYIASNRKAAHRAAAVAQAEMSNDELRDLVARLQDRLAAAEGDAGEMREHLAATLSQNNAMRDQLYAMVERLRATTELRTRAATERDAAQTHVKAAEDLLAAKLAELSQRSAALDAAHLQLQRQEEQRTGLLARLHELERELQVESAAAARSRSVADAADRKLTALAAERDKLIAERETLLRKNAGLRKDADNAATLAPATAVKIVPQRANAAADAAEPDIVENAPVAPAAASKGGADGIGYLATETRHGWRELMHVLSSAGVDIDQLAARYGAAPSGEGGPFIALRGVKNAAVGEAIPDNLKKLLKALPIRAPISQYQLESPFGARVDPINHRESFHPGIDLAAPYKTPVYNTAPGVVVFAGAKGAYGRMVEIDHGSGIVTIYGHLHRITVARGQHLRGREQIGLLGSTGRSTGPHVHYEVRVNGNPVDPEKFLQAGKDIIPASAE